MDFDNKSIDTLVNELLNEDDFVPTNTSYKSNTKELRNGMSKANAEHELDKFVNEIASRNDLNAQYFLGQVLVWNMSGKEVFKGDFREFLASFR